METSQTRSLNVKQIQTINKEIRSQASIEDGRDIIAFIGPPSSGKTTLINCILRVPLIKKFDDRTEEYTIVHEEASQNFVDNEYLIPKEYENFPDTTYLIVEFPGLGVLAGAELEIASGLAYEDILRSQKAVRYVLVVPVWMIKSDNPMEFYTLLNNLVTLCPNLPGSFCIVGTKSDGGSITACLQKAMSLNFSTANKEATMVADVAKSTIKHILDTQNCIDFKAPDKEPNESFTAPNINEIVKLIKNLQSYQYETHTPVILSEQSKTKIVDQLQVLESQLKEEIKNITKYFKLEKDDDINKGKLQNLENMMGNLENISDFPSFLGVIEKSGFSDWSIAENISEIIYIQMLMNKFQIGGDMDKEDTADILNDIRDKINQVKDDQLKNIEENTVKSCILTSKKPVTKTRKLASKEDIAEILNDTRNGISHVQDDQSKNIEDNTVNSCERPVTTTTTHSPEMDCIPEILNDTLIEINHVQDDQPKNIEDNTVNSCERPVTTTTTHSPEMDCIPEILNYTRNEINHVQDDQPKNIEDNTVNSCGRPVTTTSPHSPEMDCIPEILTDTRNEISHVQDDQPKNIEDNTVNSCGRPVTTTSPHSAEMDCIPEILTDTRNEISHVQDDQPKNIEDNTVNSCERPVTTTDTHSTDKDTAEILNDTRSEINHVLDDQPKNIEDNSVNSWEKPVTTTGTHSTDKDTAEILNDTRSEINHVQDDQPKIIKDNTVKSCILKSEKPITTTRKHSQEERNNCSNNCVFRNELLELQNEVSSLSERLQGIIKWNTSSTNIEL